MNEADTQSNSQGGNDSSSFNISIWVCAVALALIAFSALPITRAVTQKAKATQTSSLLVGLVSAVKNYHIDYGIWPPASGLISTLTARSPTPDNPRGILFWEVPPSRLRPGGIVLDAWDNPIIYDGVTSGVPHAHSSGPDGINDHAAAGSDDIVY